MDRRMLSMLQRMGIKAEEVKVRRVIFELEGERWIFEDPVVLMTEAGGQRAFQVMGEYKKEEGIREEDVRLVMEKTGKSREEAVEALKKAKGDIAEAILLLTQ